MMKRAIWVLGLATAFALASACGDSNDDTGDPPLPDAETGEPDAGTDQPDAEPDGDNGNGDNGNGDNGNGDNGDDDNGDNGDDDNGHEVTGYPQDVAAVISDNCVHCHNDGAPMASFEVCADAQGYTSEMQTRVESGNMPQDGDLESEELDILNAWFGDGATCDD